MFLAGAVRELIAQYFYRHLPLYLALCLLFVLGLGFGALATGHLSDIQKADLTSYLTKIYASFSQSNLTQVPKREIFFQSLLDNVLKTTGLLFLLGLSVIGAPLILGIVFIRGFVLGFTIGFMVQETMLRGLVLSSSSILPQNLLIVPGILLGAGAGLSFAATALKTLLGLSQKTVSAQFMTTIFLTLCSGCLLFLAALVETYLTPIFVLFSQGFFV